MDMRAPAARLAALLYSLLAVMAIVGVWSWDELQAAADSSGGEGGWEAVLGYGAAAFFGLSAWAGLWGSYSLSRGSMLPIVRCRRAGRLANWAFVGVSSR